MTLEDWLLDDSFLDTFYHGLGETYLDRGFLHRMVKNRAWNSRRRLSKLSKDSSKPSVVHLDQLLSMKHLGQIRGLDLFPEFLKNHPLVESPRMPYANFAGIGWLHLQRKWQGQEYKPVSYTHLTLPTKA